MNVDEAPEFVVIGKVCNQQMCRGERPWCVAFADLDVPESEAGFCSREEVCLRPGRLTNSTARGGIKASLDGKGIKPFITREDLADFMLAQLSSAEWVRKSPIIGY